LSYHAVLPVSVDKEGFSNYLQLQAFLKKASPYRVCSLAIFISCITIKIDLGRLTELDNMARTITKPPSKQQAEETRALLAAIVEGSSDAIVGRTLDGIVTSWNTAAEKLYGYTAEEMIGRRPITPLIPPKKLEAVELNIAKIRRGQRVDSYETKRLNKSGELIDVSMSVFPVTDERGLIVGAASISRGMGPQNNDPSARKRVQREITALHDINLAITSTLELSEILELLLEKIDLLLPYSASHIKLLNTATGNLDPLACRNIDEIGWREGVLPLQKSIYKSVLESKKPTVLPDIQAEGLPRRDFYRQQGLVSLLAVPLIIKDDVIGVLSLFTRAPHVFIDDEIEFAETLAEQASIAIHNSRLYEETKRLSHDLVTNQEHIRALARGLMHARDEEAARIAHALHDESGQLLAAVYIALDSLAKQLPTPLQENIKGIKELLDGVERRLREISHDLYPTMLEHLELLASLESLAREVSQRTGITVKIEGGTAGRLPPALELTLYRIVQEALNNVARHSRATEALIGLVEQEGLVECSVRDNGVGFDSAKLLYGRREKDQGLGLAGIRQRVEERKGELQILSRLGKGTALLIKMPRKD
jgi:PAS domain S-box-containing protein